MAHPEPKPPVPETRPRRALARLPGLRPAYRMLRAGWWKTKDTARVMPLLTKNPIRHT